jgi:3-hydroxybutyryl-CoA dehydrogenase
MAALQGTTVTVAGMGPMGRGIARVFAEAGASVAVCDIDAAAGRAGCERIEADLREAGATGEVRAAATLAEAVAGADLLIEAIVERPDAKAALLAEVREAGGDHLVVASNTSSLSIGELGQAFGDPGRVVGLHFFNPPHRMRLVEVVRGGRTRDDVVARACGWVAALGKTAVVCADSPNFIVNRVCRPLYYEAQLLVTQGLEPAVVDAAARGALGHRMGPLELLDFAGLHTHLGSSETALREFGDPRYRPIPRTRALVRAGATGRAAGRGWYDYAEVAPRDAQARVVRTRSPSGASVTLAGAPAPALVEAAGRGPVGAGEAALVLYTAPGSCSALDVAAVEALVAQRARVVVDSSHGGWLTSLPAGASWVRVHPRDGAPFAEVVRDEEAGIIPGRAVEDLLAALGAGSVEVPALPGLVVDRLMHTMINEALTVVEESTATAADVDLAMRLGMNHPFGPLEHLAQTGAGVVLGSLHGMLAGFGDPRYRPAPLLSRRAAGEARRRPAPSAR